MDFLRDLEPGNSPGTACNTQSAVTAVVAGDNHIRCSSRQGRSDVAEQLVQAWKSLPPVRQQHRLC